MCVILVLINQFSNIPVLLQKTRNGTRVGNETESEDSDWTVRTSSTVVRAEALLFIEDVCSMFLLATVGDKGDVQKNIV